jgi:Protein of unknown function (DUF1517)
MAHKSDCKIMNLGGKTSGGWLAVLAPALLFPIASAFSASYGANSPAFIVTSRQQRQSNDKNRKRISSSSSCSSPFPSALNMFDKFFEEEGPLGKGITIGKVQVALMSPDRGDDSIFAALQDNARWVEGDDEPASLADLAHDVCLSLLRKKDYWTAAHSQSVWFSANDASKAEAKYNEWANTEAAKFEKVRSAIR